MPPLDFRSVFENSRVAQLVLDPDFTIVAATDLYLQVTGTTRELLVGVNIFEAFPDNPDDPAASGTRNLRASLEQARSTLQTHVMAVQKYDIPRRTESGFEERYWNPVNTPVVIDGQLAYIIHAVEDVTSVVRLANLQGESDSTRFELSSLRKSEQAKDEFIAVISHELRTPMTSILGWTRMLALGGLDEATQREALQSLERSTLAQAGLIEDLLDESRIASGKLRLDRRGLNVREVVESAVSTARPVAAARSVRLSFHAEADSLEVFGDPSRLQQAVGNLLGNAIKFTPEGGRVSATVRAEDGTAVIEVTDTGRGIRPELLPHIFERFRQEEGGGSERQSGLGLGLSITRHVVEMHGGVVEATSAGEGRGATFLLKLPLHEAVAFKEGLVGRDLQARMAKLPELAGVRVLVVEDEVDNRNVISAALRRTGATVECAGTAAAAFDSVLEWKPDVIICDIALPDLDGCSFLSQLRMHESRNEGGRTTPALALTVLGRPDEQGRIVEAGFDVFRQKPIDPVDLAHEVARLAQGAADPK